MIDARLWRASNPKLSVDARAYWVTQLMKARREVQSKKNDPPRLAAARRKVDLAKRALGERGAPWWEDGAPDYNRRKVVGTPYARWFLSKLEERPDCNALIEATILAMLAERDATASTCPSEIARALAPHDESEWRALMPQVREAAAKLVRSRRIRVTRGSSTLSADNLSGGPIRIRRGQRFASKY